MKAFRHWLTERRDTLMALSPRWGGRGDEIILDGLVNPSYEELRGFIERTSRKTTRFILHKDRLLVWDAAKAIHGDVVHGEFRLGVDGLYTVIRTPGSVVGYFEKMGDGIIAGIAFWGQTPGAEATLRTHRATRGIIGNNRVPIEPADDSGMLVRY